MDLVELDRPLSRRHPWELARFRFFRRELVRAGLVTEAARVLDAGAGDGWFSRQLAAGSGGGVSVVCWDSGYDDALLATTPFAAGGGVSFVRERPAGRFDVVLLLDVLEHVPDDAGFLEAIVREVLSPGGHLLMSVPAWPALFTSHDLHLRHQRRYRPCATRSLLEEAGLQVLRAGGLFHCLLLPRTLRALRERWTAPGSPPADLGAWRGSVVGTQLVLGALACDAGLSRLGAALGWDLPGLSWWALCRKPAR